MQSQQYTEVKNIMLDVKDVLLDIKTGQEDLIRFVSKLVSGNSISGEAIARTIKESSETTLRGMQKCVEALRKDGANTAANKKLKTVRTHAFSSYLFSHSQQLHCMHITYFNV